MNTEVVKSVHFPTLASEFPVLLEIPPSPEVFQILPHFLLFHRFIFYIYVFSSSKIYILYCIRYETDLLSSFIYLAVLGLSCSPRDLCPRARLPKQTTTVRAFALQLEPPLATTREKPLQQ